MTTAPRKPKRMLTAEQKYDLWVRMLTGQISQADAAAEAGVDRSVITRLRAVAHLQAITDPAVLAAELERVRVHYNSVRLHEAIGYVTPTDEHDGRGDTIRAARQDGMRIADAQRRAWHRSQR